MTFLLEKPNNFLIHILRYEYPLLHHFSCYCETPKSVFYVIPIIQTSPKLYSLITRKQHLIDKTIPINTELAKYLREDFKDCIQDFDDIDYSYITEKYTFFENE